MAEKYEAYEPLDDLDFCNTLADVREFEVFESIVRARRVEESAG